MPRVYVEVAGSTTEEMLDLADGEAVVLGRNPDRSTLAPTLELADARELRFIAPSVSSNHVAIWAGDDAVRLRDLASRNGSWARLPSDVTVAWPGDRDLHLRLGFQPTASSADRPIEPPRYDEPSELGRAMAHAIARWLAERGIQVQVSAAAADAAQPTGALVFPLATGEALVVQTASTIDDRYQDLMVIVARYVAAQNAIHAAEQETRSDGMILASPAIRGVHRRVVDAAIHGVTRLVLLGPSGTGKERLARAFHRHLDRTGPLITVNCATLSRERMVADLFGAEAGAYTGAQRTVIGAVERADGGTLFLDEVGEMPLDVQAQLLRFLDTGEYQRLGATGLTRTANTHVVAATNRDLRAMVNQGTFRLDLFFRVALEVVEVPPLRERFSDAIAFLAGHSLGAVSALEALQPAALDVLRRHAWAGNFRELVNVVRRLPRHAVRESIDIDTIRGVLSAGALVTPAPPSPAAAGHDGTDWTEWLRESAAAYTRDTGTTPTTWSEMTSFIEQYLKPHALVHMAGVAMASDADAVSVPKVVEVVKADRGTVVKQIRRFFQSRR